MLNQTELQRRHFSTSMDGSLFLTDRTSTAMDGTTQYIYMGFAHPGSDETDPVWMIKRIAILADGSTASLFVNGHGTFDQVWNDHASLTYV